MNPTKLCTVVDIPLDGARGYTIDINAGPVAVFVVRKGDAIHAYINRCPHMGTSLDWQPDKFLDSSNSLIQCSTHGALFRIEDGLCIHGPCINQSLTGLRTEIRENNIMAYLPNDIQIE